MSMIDPNDLYETPNALAPHYSRFAVHERLLLTGHSHQAWPDAGFEGQQQAWLDAAEYVDQKWAAAFAKADRVRAGFAKLMDDRSGDITLAGNTHEAVTRFLSALPLRVRPRLVTTDGEFHSIRRQLDRVAEEGIEVVIIASAPADDLAHRLCAAVNDRTAAVLVSRVLYENARIVERLDEVQRACAKHGAELLVDAYHALNAVPFSVQDEGLEGAFVVGGGYKYCQLGEGNCFLRVPGDCAMRPVITGWFSEFAELSEQKTGGVGYGIGPARFAGATYDPASHYRAASVFDFFDAAGLTPDLLREVSQHQVRLLASCFDGLDLDPAVVSRDRDVDLAHVGGFLALRSPRAGELQERLLAAGVFTDSRGPTLRFGPAPYLSDAQLEGAIGHLGEAVGTLFGTGGPA